MNTEKSYLSICITVLSLVIVLCFVTGSAIATEPEQLLFDMAKKMAETKQYSVSIRMGYDVVQESGQKIEFSEIRKITVDRPNYLRTDVVQSNGKVSQFLFDGQVITLSDVSENVYAQTDHPGNLDSVIRYAVGTMGIRVPLARLFATSFPAYLQKMITGDVDYVESNTLGATPTDHIAGQLQDVDFQIWIAKDLLPRRIVMTYKYAPGEPQFWAEFSDWNLKPKISAKTFAFKPPKGAEKIQSMLPVIESEAKKKTQGGS